MNLNTDNEYMLRVMKELIDTPSPVSYYEEINPLMEKLSAELGFKMTFDRKHTAYITLDGVDNTKTVCIGAHLDTIGLIVKKINDDGTLKITQLGGMNYSSIEGESVKVHTRWGKSYSGVVACTSHSVHVFDDARTLQRDENSIIIILDLMVNTKKEVEDLGILSGDVISIEPRFQYTESGFIKSRFLDDKAAVAAVLAAIKNLKDNNQKPKYKTIFTFPHYEEIGHGGSYLPPEVSEYIAIDIGVTGPDLNGKEWQVGICAKDLFSPYDRDLTTRLINQAKKCELDYAVDIFYRYGTDANAAIRAGYNIAVGAFGMVTHSSHGMERTHIKSVEYTSKLILAYLLDV